MAVQLGLSHATHRGLGLRHGQEERRREERRAQPRGTRDRRRSERRRARLRSLIFTPLALVLPHPLRQRPLSLPSAAHPAGSATRVSTTIESIVPIPPSRAYSAI